MTNKQRDVIERARRTPARFVELTRDEQRTTRFTAADNTLAKLKGQRDPLRNERCRLIKTWGHTYVPLPHEV